MPKFKINNCINVSVFLLFSFISTSVFSQNILNPVKDTEVTNTIPSLENLDVNWWQYIEKSNSSEEISTRIGLFVDGLNMSIKNYKDFENLNILIETIVTLLNEYKKQKFISLEPSQITEQTLKNSYTINELFELNNTKNDTLTNLTEVQNEIDSIKNLLEESKTIKDQIKVQYLNLQKEGVEKSNLGLQWIDLQIRYSLNKVKLERLNIKIESLRKSIRYQEDFILQAKINISVNQSSYDAKNVQKLYEKQEKNKLEIDKLKLKITNDFSDSAESKLNNQIDELTLTLALIEDIRIKLVLNKNNQLLFLEYSSNENNRDINHLRTLIKESEKLIGEIDEKLINWKQQSQSILIEPLPQSSDNISKKITKLEKSKKVKAQQIVQEIGNLSGIKDEVLFNLDILNTQLDKIESGLSKVWNITKSVALNTKETIVNLIYKPLFTINDYPVTLLPLIKLLLIVLIGYLVSKIVTHFITRYEKKHQIGKQGNRSSLYLMHALIHYFIIFAAFMAGFSTLGINLSNITLIAGALSVGIGFGLQNLVSNFVSGLTIMFDKTLSVGDYIELEDGTTGVVREIKARSTRINTNNNIDVIIPNSDMVTSKVINWTLADSVRRVKVYFGVAYGTEKELVKKAALEAASKVEYTLTNMSGKEPDVWMVEFGDNSVNYVLLVWVGHYGLRRPNRIKGKYLWELDTALNKYNINIPFPQRDVHLNIVDKKNSEKNTNSLKHVIDQEIED